ncbi:MAG: type IV pilus twitching motility protein PilT [Acidimicrobiales bacterium]
MDGVDDATAAGADVLAATSCGPVQGDLDRLLQILCQLDGSDLHIKGGSPHSVRVDGHLRALAGEPPFSPEITLAMTEAIMPPNIRAIFREKKEADFAYSVNGVGRFRINAFNQRGSVALAIRRVRTSSATIEELGLPDVVQRLAEEQRGLVVVTGPTGSGKTTTLASMINHINMTRACHIVTVEDPIECLHSDIVARIDQREVGFDTETFTSAMRVVLRQDPDVILVGEMRDAETVFTALSAAETGHLVFSTLHTTTAPETINRIVDFFPPHQHHQIRLSLAGALKGTIGQRLVPRADGVGRVPALEVMVVNGRIQQAIADPLLTGDISQIIAEGEYYGMQTFDQSLGQLVASGELDLQAALNAASNPHDLKVMLERMGAISAGGAFVTAYTS